MSHKDGDLAVPIKGRQLQVLDDAQPCIYINLCKEPRLYPLILLQRTITTKICLLFIALQ